MSQNSPLAAPRLPTLFVDITRVNYNSERYAFKTVLASQGDKSGGLNVPTGDRKLVERTLNIGYRNMFGATHSIQMMVDVQHRPSLTENVAVKGVSVVNTKIRRPTCFTNDRNGNAPGTIIVRSSTISCSKK